MALSGIRMLSVISGRRMNSLSPFALKLKIHDTFRFGSSRLLTSQPSRRFVLSSNSLALFPLPLLQPFWRVNSNIHLRPWIYAKFFSTSSKLSVATSSSSAAAAKAQTRQRLKWKIIARVAYYLRIPFLVLSVYGIGYQQGIMDYSREPENMESKLLDTTLASVGCISPEDKARVLIAYEGEWRNLLSKFRSDHRLHHAQNDETYDEDHRRMVMMHNSSVVGEKIVKVAQSFVKDKLRDAVKEATSNMPPEVLDNEELLYQVLEHNDEVNLWTKARRHMEGPWRFVLIPSPMPNAFVSEILPHRIFITTSMFEQFVSSQDELALVLGHEISHLILGHSSERNSLETSIRTIEILLLSLDPTEGLLSIAFMSFLASIRNAVGAIHSRENERSADKLGMKLTAMACYDTEKGSEVFNKMHKQNLESGRESNYLSFFDSHPPTEERYRNLLKESIEENKEKYEDTSCAGLKSIFLDALKQGGEGEASASSM